MVEKVPHPAEGVDAETAVRCGSSDWHKFSGIFGSSDESISESKTLTT
jgi:hypothetical protein